MTSKSCMALRSNQLVILTLQNSRPNPPLTLCISENFEVLDAIEAFYGEGKVSRRAFADTDDERALVLVRQQLLGVGPGDAAIVPAVRLHLDVIARNEAWKKIFRRSLK